MKRNCHRSFFCLAPRVFLHLGPKSMYFFQHLSPDQQTNKQLSQCCASLRLSVVSPACRRSGTSRSNHPPSHDGNEKSRECTVQINISQMPMIKTYSMYIIDSRCHARRAPGGDCREGGVVLHAYTVCNDASGKRETD